MEKLIRQGGSLPFVFLLIVFLAFIYWPVLGVYAHTDAYEFFWFAKRNPYFHHVFIQGGRPLFGFFATALYQWTDSIAELKYMRMIAFAGNAVLLSVFYVFLVRLRFTKQFAAGLTLFFASSSFICLSMSWTALFQGGWAVLFGLFSAMLTLKAAGHSSSRRASVVNVVLAVAAGLISLMLYQPGFTFFVLVVFLAFEKGKDSRAFFRAVAVYLVTFVLYFLLFKATLWYTQLPPLGRAEINLDVFGKLTWFLDNAMVHAFKFNLLLVRNSFANMFRVPVVILFAYGIIQYYRTSGVNRDSVMYAIIIVGIYFMAYIPNLVAIENHASNRSLVTVVMLNVYFLYKILEELISSEGIRRVAFVLVTLIFCIFGYTNLRYGVTRIQTAEYAIMKQATKRILETSSTPVDTLHIVRPTYKFLQDNGIVQRESGGEFGLLSNSVDWATAPMFHALLDELADETGQKGPAPKLKVYAPDGTPTGKPVIDVGAEFLSHYGRAGGR